MGKHSIRRCECRNHWYRWGPVKGFRNDITLTQCTILLKNWHGVPFQCQRLDKLQEEQKMLHTKYNREWMNNQVSMNRMWLLTSVSKESSLAWFDWRQRSASEQPAAVEFPWEIKEKEKLPKITGWRNWFGKCSETKNTEREKSVAKVWNFLDLSSLRKHPDLLLQCSTKYI